VYKRVDLALSVGFLLLSLGVIVGAREIRVLGVLEDPIGARGFAYATGTFCALCSALLIVTQVMKARRGPRGAVAAPPVGAEEDAEAQAPAQAPEQAGDTPEPLAPVGAPVGVEARVAEARAEVAASPEVGEQARVEALAEAEAGETGGDDPRFPASAVRAFSVMAATIAYIALLSPLGYLLSTAAFVAGGAHLMRARGIGRLAVYPAAFSIVTYALFDSILNVRLPAGVLKPLLSVLGLE
jgi:hypothetical protein